MLNEQRNRKNHGLVKALAMISCFIVVLNGVAIYKYISNKPTDGLPIPRSPSKPNCFSKLLSASKKSIRQNALVYKSRKLLNSTTEPSGLSDGNYPEDVFTLEEKRSGYAVLHVVGIMYMFLALALVCDEFFVPALHVISKKFKISDDVAGATFMAAGGSAPEFFTSCVGVFISNSNVGFGTIVGSAVFNVLFVIGMCAVFSKIVLHLTWWPLLRDCCFYIMALSLLIFFFEDSYIEWWESVVLFVVYLLYVTFMVFNSRAERIVKKSLSKRFASCIAPVTNEQHQSELSLNSNMFRSGAMQLLVHTLDPIAEVTVEHKFQQIKEYHEFNATSNEIEKQLPISKRQLSKNDKMLSNAQTQLGVETIANAEEETDQNHKKSSKKTNSFCSFVNGDKEIMKYSTDKQKKQQREKQLLIRAFSESDIGEIKVPTALKSRKDSSYSLPVEYETSIAIKSAKKRTNLCYGMKTIPPLSSSMQNSSVRKSEEVGSSSLNEEDKPLDLSWPVTIKSKIFYVVRAPLLFLLFITIPDVRRTRLRKLYPVSFVASIAWIGIFTYLMVWWAAEVGFTAGISDEIMGFTFLAAGTSIPDLITSVVVARQGLGDMAVSSSIGSNLFDVTVGLPLPWLLKSLMNERRAISVKSSGLLCSTALLFIMLIAIVITISVNRWRMTRLLGATMFLLYVGFITLTLLIQLKVFQCPITS